jgi:hypothetical protein
MLALLQGFRGVSGNETGRWAQDAAFKFLAEFASEPVLSYAIRGAADDIYGDALEKASFLCNAFDRPQKTLFIDKTPRYFLILRDLMRMYQPESFVFLVRHPLDVLASTLAFDKVEHWRDLEKVADKFFPGKHANKMIDVIGGPQEIASAIRKLGESACVVQYENLVIDPIAELAKICDHLGLTFDKAMLEYGTGSKAGERYADDHSVGKHQAPVTDYINNWKQRIRDTSQVQSYLMALGNRVIETFGYPDLIEEFDL